MEVVIRLDDESSVLRRVGLKRNLADFRTRLSCAEQLGNAVDLLLSFVVVSLRFHFGAIATVHALAQDAVALDHFE